MPKYVTEHVISPDKHMGISSQEIMHILVNRFFMSEDTQVVGCPKIAITSIFEINDKSANFNISQQEIKKSIRVGAGCLLDSSEMPAYPNHPIKLTCVKLPNSKLGKIIIGEHVCLQGVSICSYELVSIGNNVIFGPQVVIIDSNGHALLGRGSAGEVAKLEVKPVTIMDDVWVGYGAIILPGVTIGTGAVIGAGSVVTHDVPDYCVAAGNPCKVIKQILGLA